MGNKIKWFFILDYDDYFGFLMMSLVAIIFAGFISYKNEFGNWQYIGCIFVAQFSMVLLSSYLERLKERIVKRLIEGELK